MASRIFGFLPRKYKVKEPLAGYAEALAGPLEGWRKWIGRLPLWLTPETMPLAWLPWMSNALALPTDLDLPAARRRQLLRVAIRTWVTKGPAHSIRAYVRAAAGIESEVLTMPPVAFIAGISKAGDTVGIFGWLFDVRVPTGSITEAELRRILKPLVPVFCSYTVTFI